MKMNPLRSSFEFTRTRHSYKKPTGQIHLLAWQSQDTDQRLYKKPNSNSHWGHSKPDRFPTLFIILDHVHPSPSLPSSITSNSRNYWSKLKQTKGKGRFQTERPVPHGINESWKLLYPLKKLCWYHATSSIDCGVQMCTYYFQQKG